MRLQTLNNYLNGSRFANCIAGCALMAWIVKFNVTLLLAINAYLPILKSERLTVTVALAPQVSTLRAGLGRH